jgi:hypothetical protein
MNDQRYEMMQANQIAAQGARYYQSPSSSDGAIATLRERAAHLRKQIASVSEWERELLRIDAALKAWGDK